jgi:HEAT repeat protein
VSESNGAPQVVEVQSFLSTGIDLKRLLRDVAKQSRPAVEALVELLKSQDEKIKLAAAKALLELNINVATAINDDALKRLIAETKIGNGPKRLMDVDSDGPLVNFHEIREV